MFERGDAGDGCYWLRRGVLAVCVASASGEQRILAILGQGAIVGELAMIDGLPRSASVQAIRDCELTFVAAAFTEMLNQHPPAGVARESVSRTFRDWHRQKIVEGSSASATLCTKPSLKEQQLSRGRTAKPPDNFAARSGTDKSLFAIVARSQSLELARKPKRQTADILVLLLGSAGQRHWFANTGASERLEHTLKLSGGAVKTLARVHIFDLNNSGAPPAYGIDGMHAESAIGYQPCRDGLSHDGSSNFASVADFIM